jgi:ubiquinone/menaquinone biosynthesis C-methylase UbiE
VRYLMSQAVSLSLRFPAVSESSVLKALLHVFFSLVAPYYDEYGTSLGVVGNPHWEIVKDVLGEGPHKVLDLATGTGDGAFQLASLFAEAEVVGVDLAGPMLDEARRKADQNKLADRVSFVNADAAMLPYADGSFDLVITQNAPCHVEEMVRVTRPGGVVASGWALANYSMVAQSARRRWEIAGLKNIQTRPAGLGLVVSGVVP